MTKPGAALWAEYMKIRRSKILWITILLFAFIPSMMGFMIYIVRHPEISAKLGLMAAKASLLSVSDWPAFMGILSQFAAAIGLIGFGFVTAWVFGREYTERTIKDILSLPVSRSYIVHAKFIIVFAWSVILIIVLFISGMIVGKVAGLTAWSGQVFNEGMQTFLITSFLTLLLCPPVAFVAGYSRGIIAPIGFIILTLIMAQFAALAGLGAIFPWSIPGLFTAPAGTGGMELFISSYLILIITSLLGYVATLLWWRYADQH
jgi:ABC-2 type transport system permease protein